MSRIPPPSSSRSPIKAPATPTKSRVSTAVASSRVRTQSTRSTTPSVKPTTGSANTAQESAAATLSIKEAIALRRAEAKKAQLKGTTSNDFLSLEDTSPVLTNKQEEEDILGRLSIREAIERARSTGALNLATRSLPCIPSALFEIHLGITPDPLKSVPNESVLPPSTPSNIPRRGGQRDNPAWFEAQDLQVLKIWNNEIIEVQHEISLFGSLKSFDVHQNKLKSLPSTIGDLTALTSLDLSHNALEAIPSSLFALPELTTLNVSHNALTSLPFNAPFASGSKVRGKQATGGSFFTPEVTRATSPLPRLLVLDASHNKITADAVDLQLPRGLTKVNVSSNPLGTNGLHCQSLLQVLGSLPNLKELRFNNAEIDDAAFPSTLFSSQPFPSIRVLDVAQTKVTPEAIKDALKGMNQELSFQISTEEPPEGVARILVGKQIVKEPWELELERRGKARQAKHTEFVDDWDTAPNLPHPSRKGGGLNVRSSATAPLSETPSKVPAEVVKEAWEIEAEQGLLTEGGKRRARAAAAAAANVSKPQSALGIGNPSEESLKSSLSSSGFSLANPQYYSQVTQTLTLPLSAPPTKSASHIRAFSLAAPSASTLTSLRTADFVVPTPTLPLSVIVTQPFAQTLRILVLVNRRLDKSFALPSVENEAGFLPNLEELNLEGCGLADLVSVTRTESGTATPPRSSEMILPLIAKLFPSLRTLNLSYNTLTSAAMTTDILSGLILATSTRKGLKHLRLRGNAISGLEGYQGLAEAFRGNRQLPEWQLDELDIRDNEIGKLPPELGLLPMDVFLVDGNTFRIPQRRVWEREGTKGLLSWLRGRMD